MGAEGLSLVGWVRHGTPGCGRKSACGAIERPLSVMRAVSAEVVKELKSVQNSSIEENLRQFWAGGCAALARQS
jgi:hypothetical protein